MTRETRKIQKVGGSTFSVSLPKSWAESQGLAAGSAVTVAAHPDDVLVVEPGDDDAAAERTVRVDHEDPARLEWAVRAAYAAGLDALEIEALDALTRTQRRAVGQVTDELPGSAVVEEREDRMVVRVLLDGAQVSIEQSVRQLAFVTMAMHREAIAPIADPAATGVAPNPNDAEDASSGTPEPADRHAEADRLFALVERQFQRGLSMLATPEGVDATRQELADCRAIARELQRIAADARRLGDLAASATSPAHGSEEPSTLSWLEGRPAFADCTELADLGERACDVVETATAAVAGDADPAAAPAAIERGVELREALGDADLDRLTTEWPISRVQALEHCRRTADHGVAIARIGLRGSIRRDERSASPANAATSMDRSQALLDATTPAGHPETDESAASDPCEAIDAVDGEHAEGSVETVPPETAPDGDS